MTKKCKKCNVPLEGFLYRLIVMGGVCDGYPDVRQAVLEVAKFGTDNPLRNIGYIVGV